MVRYKMLGRDINANPTQYRTWVVENTPDLTGSLYTGLKSGNNALVDISAYAIEDDSVIADFNYPLADMWVPGPPELIKTYPIWKVLPAPIADSQLAIIDGYAYMFGNNISASIYIASLNNPADWIDTGATLPTTLYGASLAIVNDTIYLFGGNNGSSAVNTIYSAPVSNPLNWTNTGAHLPAKLRYSSLGMYNGSLYLFGGLGTAAATSNIYTASTATPLSWSNTGHHLPAPSYGGILAQINNNWMMFGGQITPETPNDNIWQASVSTPTSWTSVGTLPYATSFSQFFTTGNDGYIVGPLMGASTTGYTPIIQCHLDNPLDFFDVGQVVRSIVPGVISHSQLAIIYDRIWLYGGSGLSAIFACNQQLKYNFTDPNIIAYGNITRTVLQNTDNANNPFQALCIPYWLTSYLL